MKKLLLLLIITMTYGCSVSTDDLVNATNKTKTNVASDKVCKYVYMIFNGSTVELYPSEKSFESGEINMRIIAELGSDVSKEEYLFYSENRNQMIYVSGYIQEEKDIVIPSVSGYMTIDHKLSNKNSCIKE